MWSSWRARRRPGEPGVLRDLGRICGRDDLSFRLDAPGRAVELGHHCACSAATTAAGARVHPVQQPVQLGDPGEHRVGAVGVEVEERCHGTILYRTYVRVKGDVKMWTTKEQPSRQQPQRSSEATLRRRKAAGNSTVTTANSNHPNSTNLRCLVVSRRSLRSLLNHRGAGCGLLLGVRPWSSA